MEDELLYLADETPVVLPVERIEQFQGLVNTSIIEEVDDIILKHLFMTQMKISTSRKKKIKKMTTTTKKI